MSGETDPAVDAEPIKEKAVTAMGSSVMGSLRVIELQLVAFIMVFSLTGLVPILDMIFPAFASFYLLILSRYAFPSKKNSSATSTQEIFHGSKLFRLYVVVGTTVGLFLPLAYVLGGFARGDNHAVRSATPHLFLLAFQILTENIISGLSLFSPPVRAMVPLLYTDVSWFWFGRSLAAANMVYFSVNLLCFLIPRFLPRAFESYFKQRDDETGLKTAENNPRQDSVKKSD